MKLVVGLGNPGQQYADTRHNAGFWVIDHFVKTYQMPAGRSRAESIVSVGRIGDIDVVLAKPLTFMNRSGVAVAALLKTFDIPPENLLVCFDDLAFPAGVARLRAKGGAGGHNGMRSIIQYVGTEHFPRLRIGIGPLPPKEVGVVDYVLGVPAPSERQLLQQAVNHGTEAALLWLRRGIDFAMSRCNTPDVTS